MLPACCNMEQEKDKKGKKKRLDLKKAGKTAANTAAGAAIAGSLFLGSLFSSPADLLKDGEVVNPPAIVQMAEPAADQADELTVFSEDVFEKRTWKDKLRDAIRRLPTVVKALLLLPMWAIGYGVIWGVSALAGLISLPVIGPIIKFIIGAAAVFGLLLLALKLIFPKAPLKKLLAKRNLLTLLVTSGVIALAGALGGVFWKGSPHVTAIIDVSAAAVCLLVFLFSLRGSSRKAA